MIQSNDDRNRVVFAGGNLWGGVNTVVKPGNGPTRVGIAYFVVTPSLNSGKLSASVANQGFVAVNKNNVLFPSIGVNASGRGVMTFTLVGQDYFPSAAYTPIDAVEGVGAVHIAGPGAGPQDGFTEYPAFGRPVNPRWGDYSAEVANSDGSIWLAVEYIPNAPRDIFANWDFRKPCDDVINESLHSTAAFWIEYTFLLVHEQHSHTLGKHLQQNTQIGRCKPDARQLKFFLSFLPA